MGPQGTCRIAATVSRALARAAFALVLTVLMAGVAPALAGEPAGGEVNEPKKEETIRLGADQTLSIPRVIDIIAKDLKVNFLLPDKLTGTVSIKWKRDLPKSEALDILRAILDNEGYALIEGTYFINVVKKGPDTAAIPTEVVVIHPEAGLPQSEKPVTAIIVLDYIEAKDVFNILGQLRDRTAMIQMLPRINAIIIKDAEARVNYLMSIVRKLDVPGTSGIVTVVPVQFADAKKLAETISEVLDIKRGRTSTGGRTLPGGRAVPGALVPGAGLAAPSSAIKIIPDSRLNSLIIVASQRETEQVIELIKKLDTGDVFPIHTFQCNNANASELAQVIQNFAKQRPSVAPGATGPAAGARGGGKETDLFFIADEATNKIIVAASPLDWEVYRQLLEELDQPQPQVLVEVWIVEMSSDDQFSLGVEWQTRAPSGDARIGPARQELFGATSLGVGLGDVFQGQGFNRGLNVAVRSMTNTRLTVGGKTYIIPDIDTYLKALSETNDVRVLATPKVLTIHNEQATVDITNEISISQSQVTGVGADRETVETFDRQKVGINLGFTPLINADNFVIMDVDLQVSNVVGAEITEAGSRPVISERKTKNKVRVEDGHTIIISGLRRHDRTKTISRVPVLGRLPIVGALFRSTSTFDQQVNLMIFITPHIVTDTPAMVAITEELQGQDINLEQPRFEIDPKKYRKIQRQRQRQEAQDEEQVWQR